MTERAGSRPLEPDQEALLAGMVTFRGIGLLGCQVTLVYLRALGR